LWTRLFYDFAPGEVARHIPKVWRTTTPGAAITARLKGCAKVLRRILGDRVAHVLVALDLDRPAQKFGRFHHLPAAQLAAVIAGMRGRGLIGDDGWLSERGRAVKPYESLAPDELDELVALLEPLIDLLLAARE
jgi:hypothetical protein